MKIAHTKIAWWLVIIGALNWGLVGLGDFINWNLNIVNLIFGTIPELEPIIYIVVGIAGVIAITGCSCKSCKDCSVQGSGNKCSHGGDAKTCPTCSVGSMENKM